MKLSDVMVVLLPVTMSLQQISFCDLLNGKRAHEMPKKSSAHKLATCEFDNFSLKRGKVLRLDRNKRHT